MGLGEQDRSAPFFIRTSEGFTAISDCVILHTESSCGWGGQEIRILKEASGMRLLGYTVLFAVAKGAILGTKARLAGFTVYELEFKKKWALPTIFSLLQILKRHKVRVINTHSSLDAWLGGIAARIAGKKIVRTRHLSTSIRKGLNSVLLYGTLADFVMTTSSSIIPLIARQAKKSTTSIACVPTGIDPQEMQTSPEKIAQWREKLGVKEGDLLLGTLCVVRSWKGIQDLLLAAQKLKKFPRYKWVIVGGGYFKEYLPLVSRLGLEETVTFTGHLDHPFDLLAAMDIFLLLSTAHEGISQASLQAAYLQKPLITTDRGGLPEVCIPGRTGILVSPCRPDQVVSAITKLEDPLLREQYGREAKALVEEKFLFNGAIKQIERIYEKLGVRR